MFNDMLGNTLGSMSNGKFTDIQRTAFGETTGKVDDNLNFFTGKPQVEGLGYNFLFRNYHPEIGKWQTQDPMALVLKMPNQDIDVSQLEEYAPLGYPDGWNNLAYVNNFVIACIDAWGGEIYHMVDSEAVGGRGHSATIIGNSTVGYKYYSFGSGTSSGGESSGDTAYSSYEEAFAALQKTRTDAQKSPYDKSQKWATTQGQDAEADCWARNHIDDPFILGVNDCLWFVYEVLDATDEAPGDGVKFDRSCEQPVNAFNANIKHTTVVME